jgi:hypothetical protein
LNTGNPEVTLPRTERRHIRLLYSPNPMLLLISKKQFLADN